MASPEPRNVADHSSFERVIDAFTSNIVGSPTDSQAYARCPAPSHGSPDSKPSLSLTWKTNTKGGGETFVRCHRGCDRADVLAAVGLTSADCYDTPPVRPGSVGPTRLSKSEAKGPLKLVATYPYADADGVLVYDVRRWENGVGKFSVRTFASDGAVRAKKAPAVADRVLYNLPAVLAATAGEPVFLCEGEKDADSVIATGATATTAPFGACDTPGRAAKVWLPQYTEALRGKTVRIVADRDRAGYRHALHVLDTLVGVAAAVEVVEPVAGNDTTDHLEAGRGLGELVSVARDELVARASVGSSSVGASSAKPSAAVRSEGKVLMFPSARPLAPKTVTFEREQYTLHEGKIYEVTEGTNMAGEQVSALKLILGCSAKIKRQILGGLTGDDEADALARANFERVEVEVVHPVTGATELLKIDAKAWRSGDWLDGLWPDVEFRHAKYSRSEVMAAIRAVSVGAERVAEHKATGWREDLPGHGRAYIHAGGAITAKGLVTGLPVALDGPLGNYELPAPPETPGALLEAAAHSLGLLRDTAVQPRVAVVLAGTAYRSILPPAPGFVPAFVGTHGTGKTALSILVGQHFGGSRVHRDARYAVSCAEKTGATAIAGPKWLHLGADACVLYDDFAPDHGVMRSAQRMGEFVRAAYNRSPRDRSTREGGMNVGTLPRGIPMVTAEMLPSSSSARERLLSVPPNWTKENFSAQECARLQAPDAADGRARFMSALIRWAARHTERDLAAWVSQVEAEAAERLKAAGFSPRTSEHVSRLAAGWRAAAALLVAEGAFTQEDADELIEAEVWPALYAAAEADTNPDEASDPGSKFLELVREALATGQAHLVGESGGLPPVEPVAAGWKAASSSVAPEDAFFQPATPVRIGMVRPDPKRGDMRVYLLCSKTLDVAEAVAKAGGEELGLTRTGVSDVLAGAKVGLRTEWEGSRERRTPNRRVGGSLMRVWDLPLSALFGGDGDGDGDTEQPANPSPSQPSGPSSVAAAPARSETTLALSEGTWTPLSDRQPCAACGEEASHAFAGTPLHGGCDLPTSAGEPAVPDHPALPFEDVSSEATVEAAVPATPVAEPVSASEPTRDSAKSKGKAEAWKAPHYDGLGIVCEPGAAWLAVPGQAPEKFSPPADASLAVLLDGVARKSLGHVDGGLNAKGGRKHFNSPLARGQVWLMPSQRKALGWPASIDEGSQVRKVSKAITEAGWEVQGRVGQWTRIRRTVDGGRDDLLAVSVPEWSHEWGDARSTLMPHTATAEEMAARLARFAETTSMAYAWSAASTGLQLVGVSRPALLSRHKKTPVELPLPARNGDGAEDAITFRRSPEPDEERSHLMYLDANAAYLAAARSLELPWGEYEHLEAPEVSLTRPGYWRVPNIPWTDARLPDPLAVRQRGQESMWVTTPTLKIMRELLDWDVSPLEAFLAVETLSGEYRGQRKTPPPGAAGARGWTRLLEPWAKHLIEARDILMASDSERDQVVYRAAKSVWGFGVGRLDWIEARPGKGEKSSTHPLFRPDIRHMIIAQTRYAMVRKMLAATEAGFYPLYVATDGIVYATDTPPDLADPSSSVGLPPGFTRGTGLGEVTVDGVAQFTDEMKQLLAGRKPRKDETGRIRTLPALIRAGGE